MFENIRLAFQGIWSHKMRSFLTMLGIIIGIASIIAIVSTIRGTSEQIKQELIGSGNNTVTVSLKYGDNEYSSDYYYDDSSLTPPLLSQDQKDRVRKADHVESATFYHSTTNSTVYYGNTSFSGGTVYGIDTDYLKTLGYGLRAGRAFVQADYDNYRKVAILDRNASDNLFPGEDPIGKIIEIGQEPYTVVGIVEENSDSLPSMETVSDFSNYYQSVNGCVMIPSACWPISYQFDQPENCIIKADSTDNMSSAGKAAETILNEGLTVTTAASASTDETEEEEGYSSSSSNNFKYQAADVMQKVKDTQKLSESTNTQLVFIASISLLVGGIGVMNIMLVSVTERTKEIGLKKAIGARKKTIRSQFLTEAAVLTSIGGVIGVILGIVLSKVLSKVAGTPSAISVPAIVGSVAFSTLIGIVFGLLPSVKASNLNPIDALRSE